MSDKSGGRGAIHGFAALLTPEMLDAFLAYDWPGNVRELQHTVERMVSLRSEGALHQAEAPSALHNHLAANGLHRLAEPVRSRAYLPEFRHGPSSPVIPLPRRRSR